MILLVILGILSVYFVINAEKSILVKGSEITPIGTDVPKLILNKMKELAPVLTGDKVENLAAGGAIDNLRPKITGIVQTGAEELKNKAGDLISNAASKITNLIKEPIKNKINEALCPVK